jgi:hypothetical protein
MAVIPCPHCAKPVVMPDATAPAGFRDLCSQFPKLCQDVKTLQGQVATVGRNLASMNDGHPAPTKEFIEDHWLNCPECKPRFEALLREHPELFRTAKAQPKQKEPAWVKHGR